MTRNSFSVRVERPGKALGEAMSEIRSWLDAHKIEPAAFKADTQASGPVVFDSALPVSMRRVFLSRRSPDRGCPRQSGPRPYGQVL